MITQRIRVVFDPPIVDVQPLLEGLKQSSAAFLPRGDGFQSIAFFAEDRAGSDSQRSGLFGYALFDWFYVEYMFVNEERRGQGLGAKLIAEAEAWCRERGLVGMWLQTMDFQALGFYQKQGFTVFVTHEGRPIGSATHLMEKRFI